MILLRRYGTRSDQINLLLLRFSEPKLDQSTEKKKKKIKWEWPQAIIELLVSLFKIMRHGALLPHVIEEISMRIWHYTLCREKRTSIRLPIIIQS